MEDDTSSVGKVYKMNKHKQNELRIHYQRDNKNFLRRLTFVIIFSLDVSQIFVDS